MEGHLPGIFHFIYHYSLVLVFPYIFSSILFTYSFGSKLIMSSKKMISDVIYPYLSTSGAICLTGCSFFCPGGRYFPRMAFLGEPHALRSLDRFLKISFCHIVLIDA